MVDERPGRRSSAALVEEKRDENPAHPASTDNVLSAVNKPSKQRTMIASAIVNKLKSIEIYCRVRIPQNIRDNLVENIAGFDQNPLEFKAVFANCPKMMQP